MQAVKRKRSDKQCRRHHSNLSQPPLGLSFLLLRFAQTLTVNIWHFIPTVLLTTLREATYIITGWPEGWQGNNNRTGIAALHKALDTSICSNYSENLCLHILRTNGANISFCKRRLCLKLNISLCFAFFMFNVWFCDVTHTVLIMLKRTALT